MKVLAGFTVAYLLLASSFMLADAFLTDYLLEHDGNAYELNVNVDASSPSAFLGAAPKSLTIFTGLFLVSLAMCLADEKQKKYLQTDSRFGNLLARSIGALPIWNLILLFGALVNNGGMILFKYSWLDTVLRLIGFNTDNEKMAALILFPLVMLIVLSVPSYLVFSRIVDRATRLIPEVRRQI